MRLYAKACLASLIAFALMGSATAQQSESSADAATRALLPSYDRYNCTVLPGGAFKRRIGQVIQGQYHEWSEDYGQTSTSVSIYCVTKIKPTATQLNAIEATAFLASSSLAGAPASSDRERSQGEGERSRVVPPPAVPPGTLMMKKVDPRTPEGRALEKARSASQPTSAPQDDNGMTRHDLLDAPLPPEEEYAILDVGYGRELASPPLSSTSNSADASAAERRADLERPMIVGVDERVRVTSTSYPYNVIGRLTMTFQSGSQYVCTGTLVSAYVVLTAGHCIHSRDRGGFATKVVFAPGQTQDSFNGLITQPYSARAASYIMTNNRWTQISGGDKILTVDARSDYAALYFSTPWTFTSTFMPVQYDDTQSGTINNAGYPGNVNNNTAFNSGLWFDSGPETSDSPFLRNFRVREFELDISGGNSGGPFWRFDGTNRFLVGIVSFGGEDTGGGVWIGGENQTNISTYVAWTPSQAAPSVANKDLRVPFLYPSDDPSAESYLRFFNPSARAGKATVRIADGDTGATIGTWTSPSFQPFSSVQFFMRDLENGAVPKIDPAPHANYSISIATDFPGFFQHVVWNREGQSLTNLSGCGNGISPNVTSVINVHSSLISAYPSYIIYHNIGQKTSDARISVYDARNGTRLGGIVLPAVPPDANGYFAAADLEGVLSFSPINQYHYNLVLDGSDFEGYLQHIVDNDNAGLVTNMTAKCEFLIK